MIVRKQQRVAHVKQYYGVLKVLQCSHVAVTIYAIALLREAGNLQWQGLPLTRLSSFQQFTQEILSQRVTWLTGMTRRQVLRTLDSLTTAPTASQQTVVLHSVVKWVLSSVLTSSIV